MKQASRFLRSRRGGVSVLAAAAFPVLIAVAGLVTGYGDALLTRVKMQRIADSGAFAGALAYMSNPTTSALDNAVARVTALNGMASNAASASIVNSPTGDGNQAVAVTVSQNVPVALAAVLGGSNQVSVGASSYVELKTSANGVPCIIALNSSDTGVTLSGAGAISADSCAVSSNASITAPNGTSITSPVVTYDSATAPSTTTQSNIHAPPNGTLTLIQKAVSDPLAGTTPITAATSHLSSVELIGNPSAPTVSGGTSYSFGYSGSGMTVGSCTGSTSNWSGIWTVTCTGAGPFNFGSITLQGGVSVTFNNATSATYNFSGAVNSTGSSLTFNGPGTYNIAQGIVTGGGSTTIFPAGTYNIGSSTSNCNGSTGKYSICHTGTSLTFGGPSTFVLSAGIYNSGGETLTLGSGSTNSYQIGASSNGNALWAGGGSKTTFADATGGSSVFQLSGALNIASGGGSCLTLPAATNHDINGFFSTAGGTTLGAGTYTVNGYVALGANGGGDVSCNGSTVGMNGTGVTFVISAATTISSGTCSNTAFCLAAGYSHVTLTAPTAGTLANLVVIGPTSSSNTAGATFAEGASATSLSGAFYIPYGPFTMSGGASVGNGTGQCLEVIASQVTLGGGTAMATTCTGLGGSSVLPDSIALVQ